MTNPQHRELLDSLFYSHTDSEGTIYWHQGRSDYIHTQWTTNNPQDIHRGRPNITTYYPDRPDYLQMEDSLGNKCYYVGRPDYLKEQHSSGDSYYYEGRSDYLMATYPDGLSEYYEGRDDGLMCEWADGTSEYY